MTITITRPVVADGVRLFYRPHFEVVNGHIRGYYKGPTYVDVSKASRQGRLAIATPENALIQLRLRKFFLGETERLPERDSPSGMILKNELMKKCFPEEPHISKHYVGRMLRACVQYETNFQQQRVGGSKMFWRWCHPLEFVYAIEILMTHWLPALTKANGGKCDTVEDFEEELEILNDQDHEEDRELLRGLHHQTGS